MLSYGLIIGGGSNLTKRGPDRRVTIEDHTMQRTKNQEAQRAGTNSFWGKAISRDPFHTASIGRKVTTDNQDSRRCFFYIMDLVKMLPLQRVAVRSPDGKFQRLLSSQPSALASSSAVLLRIHGEENVQQEQVQEGDPGCQAS